jgi:hypothetical protein
MYSSKVQISLFEQQKLPSLNIRITSFLRVAAPFGFFCLSLYICLVLVLTKFQHPKT